MSKEAKIGLAVISVLLIVLGGVAVWRLKFKSSGAPELATAEAKEKSPLGAASKTGQAEAGTAEGRASFHRERKETPKILAASQGHPPKNPNDGDLWNIADYRNPRKSAGEATAMSPPPEMPGPPNPENADPNDRYGLHRQHSTTSAADILGAPAGVADVSNSRHRDGRNGNSAAENDRFRENFGADRKDPPNVIQAAPLPNNHEPVGSDYGSYDQGPSASYTGNERRRNRSNAYDRWNEPSITTGSTTTNNNNGLRGDGTYDVQPNESFSSISKKIYGTEAYFKALEELNRGKSPDGQLKVGQNILAPTDASELEKKYPRLCPKADHREALQNHDATLVSTRSPQAARSYTVVEGDTLFDIARYELGKASRWAEIYDLNRKVLGKDFDYLVPGTELSLPEDRQERPNPVTRRPSGENRRY